MRVIELYSTDMTPDLTTVGYHEVEAKSLWKSGIWSFGPAVLPAAKQIIASPDSYPQTIVQPGPQYPSWKIIRKILQGSLPVPMIPPVVNEADRS